MKNRHNVKETTIFISNDCDRILKPSLQRYLDYIYADGKMVAIHVHNSTANANSIYYVQTDLLGSWERVVDKGIRPWSYSYLLKCKAMKRLFLVFGLMVALNYCALSQEESQEKTPDEIVACLSETGNDTLSVLNE